jgi:hypothetical protein
VVSSPRCTLRVSMTISGIYLVSIVVY